MQRLSPSEPVMVRAPAKMLCPGVPHLRSSARRCPKRCARRRVRPRSRTLLRPTAHMPSPLLTTPCLVGSRLRPAPSTTPPSSSIAPLLHLRSWTPRRVRSLEVAHHTLDVAGNIGILRRLFPSCSGVLAGEQSRCGQAQNAFGDHVAACPRAGVLHARVAPWSAPLPVGAGMWGPMSLSMSLSGSGRIQHSSAATANPSLPNHHGYLAPRN